MKVYATPKEIPTPDFADALTDNRYDRAKDDANIAKFQGDLKDHLIAQGYTGKLTGKVIRFPVADGYAAYMVAQKGASLVLLHLAIHDAYAIPAAHERGLTAADVRAKIKQAEAMAAIFGRKSL